MARTSAIGTATTALLSRRWRSGGLWEDKLQRAALVLTAGQVRAAELAETYAASQLGGTDLTPIPSAFGGVASDGRPLDTLLQGAAVAANRAQQGQMDRAAEAWLKMAAMTQVADAARAALRSSMAVRDASGVRMASPPCCGRCAILQGRVYHWSAGFPRHPRCDCSYLPVQGDDWKAPEEIPLDQIRGLSKADRQAIELGADRGRVINAHRGMVVANVHGVTVKATSEGMTKRGLAYKRLVRDRAEKLGLTEKTLARRTARLRPESILDVATNQEDAIRLLKLHGYIA